MKNFFRILYFLFIIGVVFIAGLGISTFYFVEHKNEYSETKILTIESGESAKSISEKLFSEKITPGQKYTEVFLKLLNKFRPIQYGEYEIQPKEKFIDLVKSMIHGKVYKRKLRIPSGLTNSEIFKIIDSAEKLIGEYDKAKIMEGMIFPDTYVYKAGDSKQHLVSHMQNTTVKNLKKEWEERDSNLPYRSIYDALIIASIIEKEASDFDDKKKVASVFLNRMKNGQKLQSDPTVQYGANAFFGRKVNLSRSHFLQHYPWSTYYVFGLPITAICNPSLSSIKAALHPDITNYNYFISMPNDTKLFFSKTYKEHLNYVAQLYKIRREMRVR
jgi:UPF0755 protein